MICSSQSNAWMSQELCNFFHNFVKYVKNNFTKFKMLEDSKAIFVTTEELIRKLKGVGVSQQSYLPPNITTLVQNLLRIDYSPNFR